MVIYLGLSEIGVGLGARCVRAPLGGLLVRQATGLLGLDLGGIWNVIWNVGIWNVEWVRMFCSCSGWSGLGWMID